VGKIHVYENNLSSKSVSFGFRKMSFIFLDVTLQTLQGYGTCFYTKNLFPMKLCGSFFVCAMMCRIQRQKLTLKVKRNLVVIFHFLVTTILQKRFQLLNKNFSVTANQVVFGSQALFLKIVSRIERRFGIFPSWLLHLVQQYNMLITIIHRKLLVRFPSWTNFS
jgi:hypothetical protein